MNSLPPYRNYDSKYSDGSLKKPIVIPQKTNIFMIKTFSPFTRAYSPSLANLPNPIPRQEFLSFIDSLNTAFLSAPIFQAAHVVGGGLLGTQILPAQVVGGVFQIASVLGSATVSIIRVKSCMKKSNKEIFAPRGLVVKIMSTKKMMQAVGCGNTDEKGKLSLPPMEELNDLVSSSSAIVVRTSWIEGQPKTMSVEDPRLRRLRALEGYIAELEFETEPAQSSGVMDKYGGAPLRWMNQRVDKKYEKAAEKSSKQRRAKAPEAEEVIRDCEIEMRDVGYKIEEIRERAKKEAVMSPEAVYNIEARAESEISMLENERRMALERRDQRLREIYKKGDKKLGKLAKKEEKLANRILWIVIERLDGSSEGEEFIERTAPVVYA